MLYKSLNDYFDTIRQMLRDGKSLQEIMKVLRANGVNATLKALETFIKDELPNVSIPTVIVPIVDKTEVIESKRFDFSAVNFDEHFNDSNELNIIEFLQKAHKYLVIKQLEIVAKEQLDYYLGVSDNQPIQSISKLRMLEEMLYKIAPYHIVSNQAEAIKVVERMGYTLSLGNENVDITTNSETSF